MQCRQRLAARSVVHAPVSGRVDARRPPSKGQRNADRLIVGGARNSADRPRVAVGRRRSVANDCRKYGYRHVGHLNGGSIDAARRIGRKIQRRKIAAWLGAPSRNGLRRNYGTMCPPSACTEEYHREYERRFHAHKTREAHRPKLPIVVDTSGSCRLSEARMSPAGILITRIVSALKS
jgi:hypothetical protein